MDLRSLFLTTLVAPIALLANNVVVSNVALTGKNTATDTYQVQFDISWENSWRTSTGEANNDAAWIFIKFRLDPLLPWNHATLSSTGHVQPTGSTVQVPSDVKGAFIFRNADGIGNVSFTGAQLQWNYGASGVPDNAVVEVRVLAIEMVLVPSGPFFLGDGTSTNLNGQYETAQTGTTYQVSSEAAITLGGNGASNLNARNNATGFEDFNYTTTQSLPATYPKGFNAYYAMKYEITEGQYVDFLNMLTTAQATARFPNQTGSDGHTVDDIGPLPDIYTTTAPERACGGLSFNSQMAYADWSALRPMSEFEYEKLCRGNRPAVANENAWGTTATYVGTVALGNSGTANELVTNPSTGAIGNHVAISAGNARPWRVAGIAASFTTPTRVQAGSGYYGAMELSGNLTESFISTAVSEARSFLATAVGDGSLTAAGLADVTTWPTQNASVQRRGGCFQDPVTRLRTSDRSGASFAFVNANTTNGARFGRLP